MVNPNNFKSLVHYVCWKRASRPETLGAIKLNKILWLSDLAAFYDRGESITGSRYIKREFGPVPARIVPTLRELEADGYLRVAEASHFGKQKKEYKVYVQASGSFLEPEEQAIVDKMINHVCDEHTASSISDASHDHIWMAAEDGEEIPHFTVFAKPGTVTDSERMWAQIQLESEMM
jgi:Protein of unknown function (DUF4065)